jgi:broad specificity phosphatase PhoE
MAEPLESPPQIPQPLGPVEKTERQASLDSLTTGLPPDKVQDVQRVFAQKALDRTQLETYIRALPTDSDTKTSLWKTYYTYEPPQPKPPIAPIVEPSTFDIVKGALLHPTVNLYGAPAAIASAAKGAVASEKAYQASQNVPPAPKPPAVTGINQPVVPPNTPLTTPPPVLAKPQLALPPLPSTGARAIAGTYGNALVLDDGSQITQSTKNLQIYHDSGYPELTPRDLQKIAQGQPLAPKGLVTPGTVKELYNRPVLKNPDGSVSTTSSASFEENGQEVLIPTVVNGKRLTDGMQPKITPGMSDVQKQQAWRKWMQPAIDYYHQTGEHLGKFDNPDNADAFAQNLHESQAQRGGMPPETMAGPIRPPLQQDPEELRQQVESYERLATRDLATPGQITEPSPWTEVAKDMYRRTVRGAEAGLSAATLGMADAATGTLHIPIVDKNFKLLPGAEERLQQLGLAAPADKWQAATNTITGLVAMGAPWAKISRLLAPLYGTAETGIAANILTRLEHTLGTAFTVGLIEPKEDTGEKDQEVGYHQSRLERIATTMGAASIFHAVAETIGGIGTARKIQAINDLKAEVSEVLYGRRPDTFDPESAKAMADKLVDQAIGEQGGVEQVERQSIKDKVARVKAASKGPQAFAGPDQQVGAAAGGPGMPMPESTPEAPVETPADTTVSDRRTGDHPIDFPDRRAHPNITDQMARNHLGLDEIPPGHIAHGDEIVSTPDKPQDERDDRIRGSVNLPLTLHGLLDVQELGKKFAEKGGVDSIAAADLTRTQQTAKALAGETGTPVRTTPNLRDIAYGPLEGQKSSDVIDQINDQIINRPDEKFEGQSEHSSTPGESFNQYKARLLPEVYSEMAELDHNPDSRRVIVVNRRSIKTIEGWIKAGVGQDLKTDDKTITGFGDDTEPGSVHRLSRDQDGTWKIQDVDGLKDFKRIPGGIYFVRHGETAWNGKSGAKPTKATPEEAKPPQAADPTTPAESQKTELPELQKPKKVFKLNGQDVVSIRGEQVVLADGSTIDKSPAYIKTLRLYGYTDSEAKPAAAETKPEVPAPVEAPPETKPEKAETANPFKGGDRVTADEGTGLVYQVIGNDVKIALDNGQLSKWIPASRVTRAAVEAPATTKPAAPKPVEGPPAERGWDEIELPYKDEKGVEKSVTGEIFAGKRVVYKSPIGQNKGKWVVGTENGMITDGPFKDRKAAKDFVESGKGGATQTRPAPTLPPPPVGGPHIPPPPEPEAEPKKGFGQGNKFFTEDDADAARKRLRDKFKQLNVGFDPEMLADMFKLGGYYFEAGAREFGAWAERMIDDIGEAIRPYLRSQFDLISQWFKDHPEAIGEEDNATGSTGSIGGHGPDEHPVERDGPGSAGGGDGGGLRGQQPAAGGGGGVRPGESDLGSNEGIPGGQPAERPATQPAKSERVERSARERFTLIGKEPVVLTPQQRRDINARATDLAATKKPGDPLTPEEQDILRQYTGHGGLQSAEEGVLFEHYTSYKMVQWHWNKLQAMGYPLDGASMLEPAAGIGNYAGFAPAGTKITMVEIDPTAAKIAALLYPQANVQNKPFEEFITKQLFDVIFSNVPFSASRGQLQYSKDAEAYKNISTLHDFFFMKSLDLAKPNGVVSFLTSTGTMDKLSPEIRKLISEKAEFLGAYRTPAGEFQKNTQYGGSVDAVFLRKRTPEEIEAIKAIQAVTKAAGVEFEFKITEEPKTGEWINARETDQFSKSGQPPARLNDYYLKNPEQMWGKPEAGYGVRQVTRIGVRPTKPIEEFMSGSLGDDIKWVPRETKASVAGFAETEQPVGKAPEGTRHGTLIYDSKKDQINYASGDGNMYPAFPKGLAPNAHQRVIQSVRMMELTDKLYDSLRKDDTKAADKIRPQLLQAIQNYRTQFAIQSGKNKGKMAPPPGYDNNLYLLVGGGTENNPLSFADPRIWSLAGLTDRNGKPSAVFTTNTIWKPIPPDRKYDPKDIEDVAKFVYEKTGELNRGEIEQRYRGTGQIDELLVGRPGFSISALSADGKPTIDINEEYLYGPIWPKIDQTEAMIQQVQADPSKFDQGILPALDSQMKELEAALPPQATVNELPADPFSSFMDQGTVLNWLKSAGLNAELEYVPENNRHMWKVGGKGTFKRSVVTNAKTGEIGDHEFDAKQVEQYLNHKRATTVVGTGEYDYNGKQKTKTVFDLHEQAIQDQLGDVFKDWFKANLDRVDHLVPTYNRMFRSFRHPSFEGKEQAIEGLAANFKGKPLAIHKHQWEATEQLLRTRSGINAHGVGAGKTSQAITMIAIARQRGLINKPLLVVPAKVAGNWAYEIGELFPTAQILNLSEMNSKNRNRMLHQVAMSSPDYIIATYEGMKEIPLRAAEDYFEEDIRQYEDRLRQMKEKTGAQANRKMETVIQEQIRKMRGKLAAIQDMKKTNAIFFEDTGIDSIIGDELHNYKNAPVQYMDMSEWLHAASYSQRAADMLYKTRYIHERKSGRKGQNVWGLTATPTPNNPIEIYNMLQYVAPDEWRDRGINDAGQFVNNFGIVGQTEEAGTTGVPKIRVNFIGYKNMNDLRPIFRRYIDMRPTSAFALQRPTAQYVEHVLNPSPETSFEAARIADIDDWITRNFKEAAANGWIPINLLTVARKLAADLAVYNPIRYRKLLGREGSKLHEIIQQVKQSDQGDNTQLIFMDLYRAIARVPVGGDQERLIKMFLEDGNEDHIKAIDVEDDSGNLSADESTEGEDEANSAVDPSVTPAPGPVDPDAKVKMKTYELVNIHKELKKALMALGIPEDQIAIINQGSNNGPKKKFAVQQANAEGKIRFLIGTTASMGEGMNLQSSTTDIHHYDVPWTPAALEQREGRGVRQGNIDKKTGLPRGIVRVHRYVGKGTSDAKMYAVLARKAKWLEELWFGDSNEVMDFDQDHRNYADISADAQIDPSTLEYWQTSRRITETEKKLKDVEGDDIVEARRMLEKVNNEIAGRQARIEEYTKQIQDGTGSPDYAQRMIEQHRTGIEALEQERLKREDVVKAADQKASEYHAQLEKDRPRLRELIAQNKERGMPVLPEHEAMANEPAEPKVPAAVEGPGSPAAVPSALGIKPVEGPSAVAKTAKTMTLDGKTYRSVTVNTARKDGREPIEGWQIAPGLAMTPSLEKKGNWTLTHTPSGLSLGEHGPISRIAAMGNRIAPIGDWERSPEDLQADKPFMQAVVAKLKGEAGALNFWRGRQPAPIQASLVQSSDPDIRRLDSLPGPQGNIWTKMRAIPAQVYRFATAARYNEDIKDFPLFAERIRRALEIINDAAAQTQKKMEWVVKGLHPVEYDVFRRIIFWEDMYETGKRSGESRIPLAGTSKLTRIDAEINRLRSISTPAVLDAVDRHHQWMEEMWNDFVSRGKADPNDGRAKYFPNMLIHELGDAMDRMPGLPYRMQTPRRLYLKERVGHQTPHDADWIHVMEQYGTRAYAHNMIDDFIERAAAENDVLPKLTQPQLVQLLGQSGQVKPGKIYRDQAGNVLKGFQFNPGNIIYPVQAINEEVVQDALHLGADELIADIANLRNAILGGARRPPIMTDMGEDLTRNVLALGGKHKTYLLPAAIADKLEHFRESNNVSGFGEMIRAATNAWKLSVTTIKPILSTLTTGVPDLSYFTHITIGNQMTLWAEDMGALAKQPEALNILRKKLPPPQYQQIVDLMEEARIWNSTFMATGGVPRAANAPGLRQYRETSTLEKITPWGNNPIGDMLREFQRYSNIVHSLPKVASFLANMERIKQGKPIIARGANVKGLPPEMAAGKAARELTTDYGATSQRMRYVYSTVFPFSSFAVGIIGPWLKRATAQGKIFPGDKFWLSVALPIVAIMIWNHYMYPNLEKDVADWKKEMTHINTGFRDADGKPETIDLELPTDVVKRWFGLHTLEPNIDKVLEGKWTWEQAARQQAEDVFGHQARATWPTAPGAMLEQMLNPIGRAFHDISANRDSFTGKEIVSKSEPNLWGDPAKGYPQTETGKQLMREYFVKQLIGPYMQYLRAQQMDTPDSLLYKWTTSDGPFGWKRALGIHSVDPNQGDRADWYNDKSMLGAFHDEDMRKLDNAYVEWEADNISEADRNAIISSIIDRNDARQTPNPTFPGQAGIGSSDIERMMKSPEHQIRVVDEVLRKTTDPEKRKDLLASKMALQQQIDAKSFKSTPKEQQPYLGLPPIPGPPSLFMPDEVPVPPQ